MHQSKSEPSYKGGKIASIRREAIDDNGGEVRAIVRFGASMEATGLAWPSSDNQTNITGSIIISRTPNCDSEMSGGLLPVVRDRMQTST